MFYDAHFTIDVTNWSRGIWLDGTTQVNACGITLAMMDDFWSSPISMVRLLGRLLWARAGAVSSSTPAVCILLPGRTPRRRRGVGSMLESGKFLTV